MKRIILLLIVIMAIGSGGYALACRCDTTPKNVQQKVAQSDAVFIGQVVTIKELDLAPSLEVKLKVTKIFKSPTQNPLGGFVSLTTGRGGADCGYPFKKGHEYLVYTYQSANNGELATDICFYTKELSKADEDLTELFQMP